MNSNKSLARCIRCESMTRSYMGEKDLHGWVMCKHCSKAKPKPHQPRSMLKYFDRVDKYFKGD